MANTLLTLVRQTTRAALRSPFLYLTVVICWTVAFAVDAAAVRFADSLFFRPPNGIVDPGHVYRMYVRQSSADGVSSVTGKLSYQQLSAIDRQIHVMGDVAGYGVVEASGSVAAELRSYHVAIASANLFAILGVKPRAGRLFVSADSSMSGGTGTPPIVITEDLWQRELGGDPHALGRTIVLRGRAFELIGVIASTFTAAEPTPIDAWVLLPSAGDWMGGPDWRFAPVWWLNAVARLRATSSPMAFQASASRGVALLAETPFPGARPPTVELMSVLPARGPADSPGASAARWLFLASAALLVIATVSVGGLLMLRWLSKARDAAVERAMGASDARMRLESIVEVGLIGGTAGLLALPVSFFVEAVMRRSLIGGGVLNSPALDFRGFAIQGVIMVSSIGVAMIISVLGVSAKHGVSSLLSKQTDTRRTNRLRWVVVAVQTGLATALLAATLLAVRGLRSMHALDLGLKPDNVVLVALEHSYVQGHLTETGRLLEALRADVRRLPGVAEASVAIAAPFLQSVGVAANAPDHPQSISTRAGVPYLNAITPEYFSTIGTPLVRGRGFSEEDKRGTQYVAVVNETLARLVWRGLDPLGHCLVLGMDSRNPCFRVVGVARDARRFSVAGEDPGLQVYIPISQNIFDDNYGPSVLLVRVTAPSSRIVSEISRLAHRKLPSSVDASVQLLADVIDPQYRPLRAAGALFGLFGATTFVATIVGVYAAMVYVVRQRRKEAGIRLAIGGRPHVVAFTITRGALTSYVIGLMAGIALFGAGLLRFGAALPALTTEDAAAASVVASFVMLGSLLAVAAPVWRTFRVPVAELLREI